MPVSMLRLGSGPEDVEVVLGADRRELLLHEHEVPELEVAVLVDSRAALEAVLRATVVGRSRCTGRRAGDAHVPVVVEPCRAGRSARAGCPIVLDARGEGLVVVLVDGRPDRSASRP
jgi:hypothetical protein